MTIKDNKTNNISEKEESISREIADKIAEDPIILYYNKQIDYYEKRIAKFPPVQMPIFKTKNKLTNDTNKIFD
jgi:hypothetical protein